MRLVQAEGTTPDALTLKLTQNMKLETLVETPELKALIKEKLAAWNVKKGLDGLTHAKLMAVVVIESLGLDLSPEERAKMCGLLHAMGNASALRQKLEKVGILEKSEATASDLKDKYAV